MKFLAIATFVAFCAVCSSTDQDVAGLVINGQDADIRDYPYMANVFHFTLPTCGGAILTQRSVLTVSLIVDGVGRVASNFNFRLPIAWQRVFHNRVLLMLWLDHPTEVEREGSAIELWEFSYIPITFPVQIFTTSPLSERQRDSLLAKMYSQYNWPTETPGPVRLEFSLVGDSLAMDYFQDEPIYSRKWTSEPFRTSFARKCTASHIVDSMSSIRKFAFSADRELQYVEEIPVLHW